MLKCQNKGTLLMKILLVNKFFYLKGGSERVFLEEADLLKRNGHQVAFFSMFDKRNLSCPQSKYFINHIDYETPVKNIKQKMSQSLKMLYSFEAKEKVEELLNDYQIDITHLHNIYHQISPSILDVFVKYKIPTAMTLHDYKLVCPSYSMLADGKPCEKCKTGKYFWCLLKKCTKGSYAKSLLNVVEMYLHHKILHIYDKIDVFISPSMFLKKKLKEMGFKKEIVHLPNFINAKDYLPKYSFDEKIICYFGRLSEEKGLFTLLNAVKGIDVKLKIIGDGPIKENLKFKVRSEKLDNVDFLGYKSGRELKNEIRSSTTVVLPSEWYENNPKTVLEAFALGKPVIGARVGGIPELVKDGRTGLTFERGNSDDLRSKIESLLKDPQQITEMGKKARQFVEESFNPEKHYRQLMKIYQLAMEKHK